MKIIRMMIVIQVTKSDNKSILEAEYIGNRVYWKQSLGVVP